MGKYWKRIAILLGVVGIFTICWHFYTDFSGHRMVAILPEQQDAIVKIVKTSETSSELKDLGKRTLDEKQVIDFYDLLRSTNFKKVLAAGVPLNDEERYRITIMSTDEKSEYSITSYGGAFLEFFGSDEEETTDVRLYIKNEHRKEILDGFLAE